MTKYHLQNMCPVTYLSNVEPYQLKFWYLPLNCYHLRTQNRSLPWTLHIQTITQTKDGMDQVTQRDNNGQNAATKTSFKKIEQVLRTVVLESMPLMGVLTELARKHDGTISTSPRSRQTQGLDDLPRVTQALTLQSHTAHVKELGSLEWHCWSG